MDIIHPYPLWIGHAGDGQDAKTICQNGIEAVLQLATEEPTPILPREILQFRFPILDGEGNDHWKLELAVNSLSDLLRSQVPTLVCCSAGASRSPMIAAFAIAQIERWSPLQSTILIRGQHPTDVSPTLWNDLLARFPAVASHTP